MIEAQLTVSADRISTRAIDGKIFVGETCLSETETTAELLRSYGDGVTPCPHQ